MNSSLIEQLRVRPHFRWTIASELTLSIVLVIVLLMGLVTYMDIRRERAVYREGLEQRGVLLASSLNDILANHMYFAQADELRDIAKVVTSQPEIAYFRIFRPDGTLLVSEPRVDGQSEYPTGYVDDESRLVIIQEGQPVPQFQEHTVQVVSPIMSGRDLLGVVHFGFNADAHDAEIRSIILEHVLQALALIVLGVALAYLIARNVSRSIGALATVAGEIGRGNLDAIVPSRGTKEAVELSDSLERMRSELQALYGGLEQRVAQRTHDLSLATEELKAEIGERQQAEEEARRLAAENQLVAEVGRIITSSLDINLVYQGFAERVQQQISFEYMSISLVGVEAGIAIPAYVSGKDVPGRQAGDRVSLDGSLTEAVMRTRSSMLINADNVEELGSQYPGLEPALAAGMRSFLSVPLIAGDEVIAVLNVRSTQLYAYTDQDLKLIEQVGHQVAPAIQNAELYEQSRRAEEALLKEMEARKRREEEIQRLALAISTIGEGVCVTDLQGAIQFVNPALEQMLGYKSSELIGRPVALLYPGGSDSEALQEIMAGVQSGVWFGEVELIGKDGERIWTLETATPMFDEGREVVGYVCVNTDIRERKQAQESLGLRNQELQALSRQLVEVQEQERRHVARELHDEIGQLLTGLKLTLEVIPRLEEDAGKAKVEQAKTMVNELMVQVRELSLDLRPAMLDDLGLLPTLLWYFERFTARTQVKVSHEHVGLDRRFRPEVETTAYRIVQEALTNVARHAGTSAVTVRMRSDQHNLLMEVHDHGAGFDPDAVMANHHSNGLYGMRERAILLGGQLTLETAPGDGTRLIAELPLGDWPVGDGNLANENGSVDDLDSTGG